LAVAAVTTVLLLFVVVVVEGERTAAAAIGGPGCSVVVVGPRVETSEDPGRIVKGGDKYGAGDLRMLCGVLLLMLLLMLLMLLLVAETPAPFLVTAAGVAL
jgi:hypothetical protein